MSERHLEVSVITPEGAIFEGRAKSLVVPAFDGEMAFYPGHAAFVGALGAGELRVRPAEEPDTRYFFLQGGVVRVAADRVAVLAESVQHLEAIDVEAERERLREVIQLEAVESLEALDSRHLAADAARARIRAAQRIQD